MSPRDEAVEIQALFADTLVDECDGDNCVYCNGPETD